MVRIIATTLLRASLTGAARESITRHMGTDLPARETRTSLPEGSTFGVYEIRALLGAGGMGEVYRAFDPRLGREIALKVIRRLVVGDESALDRLLREATLASALNHPNIVTIYETGVVGSDRYIAMELVDGATLRQLAAQGLPLARIVGIARQVSEALAVAHAAQIIHRDIKPDNVMVRPDGYVKLLDFGLARVQPDPFGTGSTFAGHTAAQTEAGLILGTIGYMAPEQARGEPVTAEADVFSLGVLLYELVTGRHPFMASSQLGTLHALLWETPEPPALLNHDLPRALDQLILEALQKDQRLRPGASEVMYRLALAHDSSIATALSAVTVSRRPTATSPIVGREQELDAMNHEFDRAQRGNARMVVISGEAGVGKTTLVEAFVRQLEERGEPMRVGRGRCSERLAGSEAYLPVLEALDSLQRNEQLGSLSRLIRALAPSWYAQLMPPSENDSSAARLAAETAGGSQERLKREIAALLEEVGRIQPVMLWFDDAHWADASTTDLIGYLARRLDATRLLIVVTGRPSELAQLRHPFLSLKLDLLSRGLCREITPSYLDTAAIDRYIALQFPEHAFPPGFAELIHHRTEGNPLFMTDVLRDLRRRQVIQQRDGRWVMADDLSSVARELPESVRSLIQRKLDALDDTERRLLSAASVQGMDFDSAVVARALRTDEEDVETRLERLEREHALVRFVRELDTPDRALTLQYRFAHHMYQNVCFDSLRATRKAALSRAIAERLVERFGDHPCDCLADIAMLFEVGRDSVRAADYWNRAAQAAGRLYAHDESARLAQRGLALLTAEPASPARAAAELSLQMTYGLAIKTSKGYAVPEVGRAYERARELCRQVDDPSRVIPVLIGMSAHHIVAGEIRIAHGIAVEMMALFERIGDPHLQMIGEWSLGASLFHVGDLEDAHRHLERSLTLYDPEFHGARVWQTGVEPGIFCRCELSRTQTLRGYPDSGLATVQEAVAAARALDHPQPLAFALLFEIFVRLARREPREVQRTYDQLAVVCQAHGIAQELHWAAPLVGRAFIELGDVNRGLRVLQENLAAHMLTRSTLLRPYYFVLLAGALLRAGLPARAQTALDEAATVADATGQHAYGSEHARLQAEVIALNGSAGDAERHFQAALAISRRQGAHWLELRAARGYAHHLVERGRPSEARDLLAPVVASFTEGLDTMDFLYAEGLLKTLD
jgi:serine/threonine protein kinase/predicted ATPase/GTPase SAR1 family protein